MNNKKLIILATILIILSILLIILNLYKNNNNNYIDEILEYMDSNNLKCENSKLILLGKDDDDDVRGYAIKDYNK